MVLAGRLAACGGDPPGDAAPLPEEGPIPVASSHAAPVIDPGTLSPGDTLGGLRVDSVGLRPAVGEEGTWVGFVRFAGPVRLTGRYGRHPSDAESEALCFFPDDASEARLPRLAYDERYPWLCFEDRERASELLGEPGARARTVTVEAYRYAWSRTDVYNTARLVSVDEGPPPR